MPALTSSPSIDFILLLHPKKPAQEWLSASLFTGATHKLREVVNHVFPSPFSSYGYTDLQHISVSQLSWFWLNPHGTSWELHCQAPSLMTKPNQGAVPKEKTAPPCTTCLHTRSSRMHQCYVRLEAQQESIKTDWIVLKASQHQRTRRRTLKGFITMKWWSKIFWIRGM